MLKGLNMKKGVSLVTVLLFMLVATIAATATFKWLNSEGRTSAARLAQNEARQAAIAGITTARAWMMEHGNETGALIRQIKNNGKKPIRLNNVMQQIADNVGGQKFDVWLVSAETEAQPYNLKVVSMGTSRNGTKFSEVGILKVAGLFQVKIPIKKVGVSFNRAFFGKSKGITGDDSLESGIVNGDFTGNNVPVLADQMLVTGNLAFQGGTGQGGDLYVVGDYKNEGSLYLGDVEKDNNSNNFANCVSGGKKVVAYIGGSMSKCAGGVFAVCGDLYVGGNVSPTCRIKVDGNLTINGKLYRGSSNNGEFNNGLGVKKNLVFTDKASWEQNELYFSSTGGGSISSLKVGENMVLPPTLTGMMDTREGQQFKFDINGKMMSYTTANTMLLEQGGHNPKYYGVFTDGTTSDFAMMSPLNVRGGNRYMSFNANGGIVNRRVGKWEESDDNLKNLSDGYWTNYHKMLAYGNLIAENGEVPTPILLQNEDEWKNHTVNSVCNLGNSFNLDDENIRKLNKCYADKKDDLTNGFLVIKWMDTEKRDPTIALDGKFVFYCPNKIADNHMTMLPKTTESSVVMLYLENGAGLMKGSGTPFKYFIYSNRDIEEIQEMKLTGGIIMNDGSTLQKYQGKNNLRYDDHVVQELLNSKFIIGNEEYEKRAGMSVSGSNSSGVASSEAYDNVYVAVSPHLKVTLESEYKNNEFEENDLDDSGELVKPSILVLPRIVYLPKDAKGKLSDYYHIVNLNGANIEKNPSNVSCSPSFPTTGNFADFRSSMKPDIYNCTYSADGYDDQVFYVVVNSESLGEDPTLNFAEPTVSISPTTPATVKINMSSAKSVKVDVFQEREPEGWTVHAVPKTINADGSKIYTIDLSQSAPVFEVSMSAGAATQGGITFQMIPPCEGCNIGAGDKTNVVSEGSFIVKRRRVEDYCLRDDMKNHPDCLPGGKWYDEKNAPDCGSLLTAATPVWVQARGVGCETQTLNDEWSCSIYVNPNIYLQRVGNINGCHVANPSEDGGFNIVSANLSGTDVLYASLKRDIHTLVVNLENAENSDTKVLVSQSKNDGERSQLLGECRSGQECAYTVYSGYTYFLDADKRNSSDKFSHWKCVSGNCPIAENNRMSILVNEDYNLTAVYNENDSHCLFEDFAPNDYNEGFSAFCDGSSNRCIDVCSITPTPGMSCKVSEASHWKGLGNARNPDWVMVYDNRIANSSCSWDYSGCMCADGDKACRLRCRRKICSTSKTGSVLEPLISNNFIVANSAADDYSNVENATQGVILSTKDNGRNGTLTSIFSTAIVDVNTSKNDMLNSGFIIRSTDDASEYFSVSVYGKHAGGKYSPYVYGKLCYVNGQTASDVDESCVEKYLPTSEWGVDENGGFTNMTKLGLVLKMQNERVTLNLTLDHKPLLNPSHALNFSLKDVFGSTLTLNDVEHNHVGFKLTDKDFKLYDISWSNSEYGAENCFSVPKLVCSFKTNYLGGMVPQGEVVTPWVSTSSFLLDDYAGCSIKYYYNGCDNDVNYERVFDYTSWMDYWKDRINKFYCNEVESDAVGMYWDDGRALRNENFKFVQGGRHGYYYEDEETGLGGFAKDAKVRLECPSGMSHDRDISSLMEPSSCGEFYVGQIAPCEKNHDFMAGIESPATCSGSGASRCHFELEGEEGLNARDAKILMKVDNPAGFRFRVIFTDVKGIHSTTYTSSRSGEISFDINDYSNEDGFDPQRIASADILLDDGNYMDVSMFKSSCPNALGITSCNVSYKGAHWEVKATFNNADQCSVIPPAISNAELETGKGDEETSCPGTFRLKEPGLRSKDNMESYVFKVTASKGSGDKKVTETFDCDPYEVTPVEIHCSIDPKDQIVEQGAGIPKMKYHFDNCPEDGCPYKITLSGKVVAQSAQPIQSGPGKESTLAPSRIVNGDEPLVKGAYYYTIEVNGKTNTECGFEVVEVQKKAKVENCAFDANTKKFTADVTILQGGSWSGSVNVTDQLSNPLSGFTRDFINQTEDVSHISVDYSSSTFSPGVNAIRFTVNSGEAGEKCQATYEYVPENTLTLTCPTDDIDGDLDSRSFSITGYKVGGCSDPEKPCSWSISKGKLTNNMTSLSVIDNKAELGRAEYTLTLSRGKSSVSCPINVRYAQTSSLDVACPSEMPSINAKETINFQPLVQGCDHDCSYTISNPDGGYLADAGGYTDEPISFMGENLSGTTRTYTFSVKDATNMTKSCNFQVGYKGLGVGCPNGSIKVNAGEEVTISPNIMNCPESRECEYWIEVDGTSVANGDALSGESITFTAGDFSNVKKNYTLNVKDKDDNKVNCSFSLNYNNTSGNEKIVCSDLKFPEQSKTYPSGTCFDMSCSGNNTWGRPIKLMLRCDGSQGIKFTWTDGGSSKSQDANNWSLGSKITELGTGNASATANNVCVYSTTGSATLNCVWGME